MKTITNYLHPWKAEWTPNVINSETCRQISHSKNVKCQRQRENLKNKRKTMHIQGNPSNLTADFSTEAMEAGRQWNNTLEVLEGKWNCQQRIQFTAKIYFKNKGEIKTFSKAKTEIICCYQIHYMRNTKECSLGGIL